MDGAKKEGKKRRDSNQPLGSLAKKQGWVICIRQDDYEPADALREDRVSKGASAADRVFGGELLGAGRKKVPPTEKRSTRQRLPQFHLFVL